MKPLERITFDPLVMGPKPCIRGMRVTVGIFVTVYPIGLRSILRREAA